MNKEIWRDIEGYEGLYQVSTLGRVKSLKDKYENHREKILIQLKQNNGYLVVNLHKNGKLKRCTIHRLVARAFIHNPNPNHYTQVNHIDENKSNNNVENLEWCTAKYNTNYGKCIEKRANACKKPVIGINKINGYICEFNSISEVERVMGICAPHITECCKGKAKSAGGYRWFYANINDEEVENK